MQKTTGQGEGREKDEENIRRDNITDKIIDILILLERKISAMDRRLEKIEDERTIQEEAKSAEEKRATPGCAGHGGVQMHHGEGPAYAGLLGDALVSGLTGVRASSKG